MNAADDLARRLARVKARMRARGLNGLMVYFNGQHHMLRFNPLLYLSDLKPLGPAFLFLPAEAEPALLISPEWDFPRVRESVPFPIVKAVPQDALAEAAAAMGAGLGKPLAIAGRAYMAVGFAKEFLARFDCEPYEAGDLIDGLAAIRTEVELARVSCAAMIADTGFAALRAAARVGMREYELAAEVEHAMQCAGADDNYGLLGAGSHNLAIRAPTDRLLESGDLIIGEITPCYRGYFAQLCRTLVLGEPSRIQIEKYDLLIAAQEAGLAAARPGRSSRDIAHAINAVIAAGGYADYCRQPYMRTRGHGLGFGGVVPADLNAEEGVPLAPAMTMVIHPNQYIPETGYMMLGDTVVIEAAAPRLLTATPRQLFWNAA
jgi:Xaa-Pro dipeptidase